MRQVCKALRDLTHERLVWATRYAKMVEERQLPTPKIDPSLSTSYMEAAVRRNELVESAWRRGKPKMESLRPLILSGSWIYKDRMAFMIPGGQYLLIFVSNGAFMISLEEPSPTPVPFISLQGAEFESLDTYTSDWTTGRPDDGSLTFFATLKPRDDVLPARTFAFWSANFQISPPTQIYHGQLTVQGLPSNARTRNELFVYSTADQQHAIILDWRAMLQGVPFRYYAFRFDNRTESGQAEDLYDFCVLPNGCILVIDTYFSLHLFAPPRFETVTHLNQALPTEYATPIWQYPQEPIPGHSCSPSAVWPLPLCHPHADTDESNALIYSRATRCYRRLAIGPKGSRILDHRSLPDWSTFIPGRTRAVIVTLFDNGEGSRIGCISYATKSEDLGSTSPFYETFDLTTADLPGLPVGVGDTVLPNWLGRNFQTCFDEQSGRLCFVPRHTSHYAAEMIALVLDFV